MAAGRIVRRDFLNRTLLGAGAALLRMPAPAFAADTNTGYAGVGDYARSNGDPWPVVEAGHRMRDGGYASRTRQPIDTGEQFDPIVLGAGLSGLGTPYYYRKAQGGSRRCLVRSTLPASMRESAPSPNGARRWCYRRGMRCPPAN
jgi:spermidine dehydrogenase